MSKPVAELQTRFRQTDSAGILFFAEVFNLTHDAYEEWTRTLGFSYSEWFENPEWAAPLVHSSADFKKPIRAGETLQIDLELTEISDKSFTAQWTLSTQGSPSAVSTTKHTFVDKSTFKSIEIPSSVRSALETFQK